MNKKMELNGGKKRPGIGGISILTEGVELKGLAVTWAIDGGLGVDVLMLKSKPSGRRRGMKQAAELLYITPKQRLNTRKVRPVITSLTVDARAVGLIEKDGHAVAMTRTPTILRPSKSISRREMVPVFGQLLHSPTVPSSALPALISVSLFLFAAASPPTLQQAGGILSVSPPPGPARILKSHVPLSSSQYPLSLPMSNILSLIAGSQSTTPEHLAASVVAKCSLGRPLECCKKGCEERVLRLDGPQLRSRSGPIQVITSNWSTSVSLFWIQVSNTLCRQLGINLGSSGICRELEFGGVEGGSLKQSNVYRWEYTRWQAMYNLGGSEVCQRGVKYVREGHFITSQRNRHPQRVEHDSKIWILHVSKQGMKDNEKSGWWSRMGAIRREAITLLRGIDLGYMANRSPRLKTIHGNSPRHFVRSINARDRASISGVVLETRRWWHLMAPPVRRRLRSTGVRHRDPAQYVAQSHPRDRVVTRPDAGGGSSQPEVNPAISIRSFRSIRITQRSTAVSPSDPCWYFKWNCNSVRPRQAFFPGAWRKNGHRFRRDLEQKMSSDRIPAISADAWSATFDVQCPLPPTLHLPPPLNRSGQNGGVWEALRVFAERAAKTETEPEDARLMEGFITKIEFCRRPGLAGHAFLPLYLMSRDGAVPGYTVLERYSSGSPFASFLAVKARDKGGIDRDLRNLLDLDPQHYVVSSIVIPSSIELCSVTAIDVFSVASAVSQSCRDYTLLGANCLWFAGAIMHAICEIFLGHPGPDHGPAWSSTALLLWPTDFEKGLKIIKESYQKARHELQVQVGHEKVKMELEGQKVKDLESEKMARIKSLEEKDENNQEVHQVVVLKINIR
ncbi:hypothetical protein FB451DRAFT_1380125 [Mycena latifolia]|nr:hypothetical protein FB451DRAFT_1380125 [Mycena latifolia]